MSRGWLICLGSRWWFAELVGTVSYKVLSVCELVGWRGSLRKKGGHLCLEGVDLLNPVGSWWLSGREVQCCVTGSGGEEISFQFILGIWVLIKNSLMQNKILNVKSFVSKIHFTHFISPLFVPLCWWEVHINLQLLDLSGLISFVFHYLDFIKFYVCANNEI